MLPQCAWPDDGEDSGCSKAAVRKSFFEFATVALVDAERPKDPLAVDRLIARTRVASTLNASANVTNAKLMTRIRVATRNLLSRWHPALLVLR